MRSSDFPVIVSPAASAALSRGFAVGGPVQAAAPPAPGALNGAAAPPDPSAALGQVAVDAANACGRLVKALRILAGPNAPAVDAAAANLRQALAALVASAQPNQGGQSPAAAAPAPMPPTPPAGPAPAMAGALQ